VKRKNGFHKLDERETVKPPLRVVLLQQPEKL